MSIKQMIVLLFSQPIFIYAAAGEIADKLTLLDCYERKTVAVPGVGKYCKWTAQTTKLLRCCVGSVEDESERLIDKAVMAISLDLHPENKTWVRPFDSIGDLDLKQFIPNANLADRVSRMKAALTWFRCTDDCPAPCLRRAEGGIQRQLVIMPASFKEHMLSMLMSIGAEALHNTDQFQALQLMLQKKEITPEVMALLDAYARRQAVFHEASYLVLKPEKFAAFAEQEFGS